VHDAEPAKLSLIERAPIATALLVGGLSGASMALGDFGAMWLWLPLWRDRAGLLLRLVSVVVPASALFAALLTLLFSATIGRFAARLGPRAKPYAAPLGMMLVSALPLHVLAQKLMSGGAMSRLRLHDLIVVALSVCLPVLAGVAVLVSRRLASWVHRSEARLDSTAILGLTLGFLFGKINQTVLPNLYDYLHHALTVFAWFSGCVAALAWAVSRRAERVRPWLLRGNLAVGLGVACVLGLAVNLWTLNLNLNVRVAMFDARSATSRSLLSALNPLLRWIEDARPADGGGLELARKRLDTTGLPSQPGAHVVLITVDALRADHLGSYGYPRPVSPRLDALSKNATQFDRAYAQAPHSSYSISSLMTSEYIHEVVELDRALPSATIATTLRDQGYHTAAFFTDGIFHTEGKRLAIYRDSAFGFALFDHTNRESEDQTDRVLKEADRILENGEPPSFLWVHYFDVHEPYQETTLGTGEMDRYDSEVAHVDRELARLLAGLKQRFKREMVLAITADHGEEFRDHGGVYHGSTLYEEQVRVPLILQTNVLPKGRIAPPVEVIDLGPTLLGLVAVDVPESMRGRDLRAVAMNRVTEVGPVFSAVLTKRMAVQWPYKIIADLRFGLFELYDLKNDPHERRNQANLEPARLSEMKGLVYSWLDSLETAPGENTGKIGAPAGDWSKELRWGRLGDRRAVEPMSRLLLDTKGKTSERVEAGQILAKLADTTSAPALVQGLGTTPPEVAAEAAIALGRMYDERAKPALQKLVHVEDPYVRARAAVSLGRLRDPLAVPALLDALWVAPTQYEREEAVRWLGRLRDRRAVEPLLQILTEFNLRYLVSVALGQIGDSRAYAALSDMIEWEHHTNIRDEVVRGLGLLGDERALPLLVEVLRKEPELKNTAESLVRLGALTKGYLGGVDVARSSKGLQGFERCDEGPLLHDWDYLNRTFCTARGSRLLLRLPLPTTHARWTAGAELIIRMRRTDAPDASEVRLSLAGKELAIVRADASWADHRIKLDPDTLPRHHKLEITSLMPEAKLAIDHVLLVPQADVAAKTR